MSFGFPKKCGTIVDVNILLIHPQADIREMIVFPLEGSLAATTMGAADEKESRELLVEKKFSPEVIIAENSTGVLELLTNLLQETALEVKLVLCDAAGTGAPPKIPGTTFLGYALYDNLLNNLVEILRKIAPAENTAKGTLDDKYCRINTALLLKVNPLAADIFIRLSPTKFVKMFSKNDVFDQEDLLRYRDKKKLDYLYLVKEDTSVFVGELAKELEKMLSANPPPSSQTVNETAENAVETIHELIAKFGVTEEVQKVMKTTVQVTMKAMGEFPDLAAILKSVTDHKGQYIGHHTMLVSNIACSIAVAMDWYSDSTFEKLTLAAFLHDAALQDHALCAVKTLEEFSKVHQGKYSMAQIQEYKSHPQRAVHLLGHFKDAPAEVDKIILQHHEHPMGSGFPDGLTSNYISPLSSLFIVAHDLADFTIDHKDKWSMEDFLIEFEKKYSAGNFKKIAKAIASVTLF